MRKSQIRHDAFALAMQLDAEEVKKLLIDNGAEVNAKAEKGTTPLDVAAMGNAAEVVKLLIDSGAEVNTKDKNGDTPLHWAAPGKRGGGCETAD